LLQHALRRFVDLDLSIDDRIRMDVEKVEIEVAALLREDDGMIEGTDGARGPVDGSQQRTHADILKQTAGTRGRAADW